MSDRDDSLERKKQTRRKTNRDGKSSDRSSITYWEQKLKVRDKEIEVLQEKLTDQEAFARRNDRQFERKVEKLNYELKELGDELKIEIKNSNKYRQELNMSKKNVTQLKEDLQSKDDEISSKDKRIAELMKRDDKYSRKSEVNLQGIKEVLESQNIELHDKIKRLEQKAKESDAKNEEILLDKKNVIDKLRSKIDSHIAANKSLMEEKSNLVKKNESFMEEKSNLMKMNESLQTNLRAEKTKNEELSSLLKNLQLALEEHKSKIETLERERTNTRSRITSLNSNEMATAVKETPVRQETIVQLTSTVINEESAPCPNCSNMFGISIIEKHLEMCLEPF